MALADVDKKKKLRGMPMPGRGDSGLEIDLGGLDGGPHGSEDGKGADYGDDSDDSGSFLGGLGDNEEGSDGDTGPSKGSKADEHLLAAIPDDELLAEIKKRGLDKDLEEEEGEGGKDQKDSFEGNSEDTSDDDDHILRA